MYIEMRTLIHKKHLFYLVIYSDVSPKKQLIQPSLVLRTKLQMNIKKGKITKRIPKTYKDHVLSLALSAL